jgi:hypothetical protein
MTADTAITLDDIKAAHAQVAALLASYEAQSTADNAAAPPRTIHINGASIELQPGEHYAGLILGEDGTPEYHLVLLAAHPEERMEWSAAVAWASSIGGELPNRREQSLLFANAKGHFDSAWYWSSEKYEDDGAYAWYQDFDYGYQGLTHTSYAARVRAVRRIPA